MENRYKEIINENKTIRGELADLRDRKGQIEPQKDYQSLSNFPLRRPGQEPQMSKLSTIDPHR